MVGGSILGAAGAEALAGCGCLVSSMACAVDPVGLVGGSLPDVIMTGKEERKERESKKGG